MLHLEVEYIYNGCYDKFSPVYKMTSKQEEQRVKILLAQQENPTFSHAKLAKLLDVAKSGASVDHQEAWKRRQS